MGGRGGGGAAVSRLRLRDTLRSPKSRQMTPSQDSSIQATLGSPRVEAVDYYAGLDSTRIAHHMARVWPRLDLTCPRLDLTRLDCLPGLCRVMDLVAIAVLDFVERAR